MKLISPGSRVKFFTVGPVIGHDHNPMKTKFQITYLSGTVQEDNGTTFTLTDSLPYEPILGKQGKIVAILGKSGLLRLYFSHSDSYHIIPPSMISRTIPAPYPSFDFLIANL